MMASLKVRQCVVNSCCFESVLTVLVPRMGLVPARILLHNAEPQAGSQHMGIGGLDIEHVILRARHLNASTDPGTVGDLSSLV